MDSHYKTNRRRFLESCGALMAGSQLLDASQAVPQAYPLAAAPLGPAGGKVSLDGTWNFRPLARTTLKADGSIVAETSNLPPGGQMPVPSNWHLHGLPNFNGRVRFERAFGSEWRLPPSQRAFLIFHGVDYFTEVELNGAIVDRQEGYFQTFEFDVTPQLKPGRNLLEASVDAPKEEVGTVWPDHKRLIKGIFSHWDCKPGGISKEYGQDGTSAGICWRSGKERG